MPLFAVEQSCRDFRRGVIGNGHWAPTAAEIRQRAESVVAQYRAELADISEVIEFDAAGIGSGTREIASMKQKVVGLFGELKSELASNSDPWADKQPKKPLSQITPQEAQNYLDNLLANPLPPPELSDELAARIKR